jgi:hypothetical protein
MEGLDHTYIYSYQHGTDKLWRTNLLTGEQSCYKVLSFRLKTGCYWSELPGGSLLITGGVYLYSPVNEAVKIDTRRELAVTQQPPMLTARGWHCAVYHNRYLYVLGGCAQDDEPLESCERYVVAECLWEALPPLPQVCPSTRGVVVEGSLYALGGYLHGDLDLIQKLSLDRLTWEVLQIKLPQPAADIACFTHGTQAYFVLNRTLYSLQPLRPLKALLNDTRSYYGPSYYSRGTLYGSFHGGAARRIEIGSLTT